MILLLIGLTSKLNSEEFVLIEYLSKTCLSIISCLPTRCILITILTY